MPSAKLGIRRTRYLPRFLYNFVPCAPCVRQFSIVFMEVIECSLIARKGWSNYSCFVHLDARGTSWSSPSVISANCWFVDGKDRWRCVSVNTEDICIGYRFICCYMAANAVTYLLSNSTTLPGPLWVKDMSVWPLLDLTLVRWRAEALVKVTLFETAALAWVRGVIPTVSYFCGLPRLWYSLFVVLPSWVSLTVFLVSWRLARISVPVIWRLPVLLPIRGLQPLFL